ncbi:DUF1553 domain-containing protein [Flexithrix dorotheae]|uniref:DUF1553 domain-containing protein n=1 Tax=Flexithrix dorotheae TaxID=70993 RepID=UPI0005C79B17|nr:DUF1553 domain-containing protein [Flexithrix dorotheae]
MKSRITIFIGFLSLMIFTYCGDENKEKEANKEVPKKVSFNFHVKPILSDKCFACHGPDNNSRKAGLRLDTEKGAFAALEENEGFAIIAGDLDKSAVYHRIITDDPELVMPPPESNLTLTAYEKEVITKWIKDGAKWEKHWAYNPPKQVEPPKVGDEDWLQNPIDNFVLSKMQENKLKPAEKATKAQLIRRASFDITGLPPTLEEIDDFLKDESPDAFEKVVDRLFASPAYGEKMASIWLDVARYADSHGYQDDRPRTMWPWRDWVIKAFNSNLTYDNFVTQQLAGDLLPNPTFEEIIATGFNRNHAITQEGGIIEEEYLTEYAADRVNTFSTAFMGVTMECARCHDHKYDPLYQKEYFQLMDFFNNIPERGKVDYHNLAPEPAVLLQDEELEKTIAYVNAQIKTLEEESNEKETSFSPEFEKWLDNQFSKKVIEENLPKGLIAKVDFDNREAESYKNNVNPEIPVRVNLGLPAKIPEPQMVEGKNGKALSFDGDNYATLGDIADFDHCDRFSFGGWIKHSGVHEKNAGLFARKNGEIKREGYHVALTPQNKIQVRLLNSPYNQPRYPKHGLEVMTKNTIKKGEWAHVFVTYDGSSKAHGVNVFINGEKQKLEVIQDDLDRHSILNGNTFLVGNWNHRARKTGELMGFEGGLIDEVRIYNRELSPLEVKQVAGFSIDQYLANKLTDEQLKKDVYQFYLNNFDEDYLEKAKKLDHFRYQDVTIPYVMVMEENEEPKPTFLLARGVYDAPTEKVEGATPVTILPYPEEFPKNRMGLSNWLFDEKNPLTARVMVNRLWANYFGRGLVKTPEDFGNQGDLPSHPELLDWLAVDFRENNWDMKAIQKKMVMSATYQQSSKIEKKKYAKDSENKYLARGPLQKLSAEMVRDNVLAVSGLLENKIGGKWVKPYQPAGIWKAMANQIGENKYREGRGTELYRRSLYTYWKRTIPPPSLITFDAPERAVCTVKRQATSTPLQSLVLLNDPQYVEASRHLAQRIITEGGTSLEEQLTFGFRLLTSRFPQDKELEILKGLYEEEIKRFDQAQKQAEALITVGASANDEKLDNKMVAAFTVVANAMINLDEAKYRG